MPIKTCCPACSHTFSVIDLMEGREGVCENCGHEYTITKSGTTPKPVPKQLPPQPQPAAKAKPVDKFIALNSHLLTCERYTKTAFMLGASVVVLIAVLALVGFGIRVYGIVILAQNPMDAANRAVESGTWLLSLAMPTAFSAITLWFVRAFSLVGIELSRVVVEIEKNTQRPPRE